MDSPDEPTETEDAEEPTPAPDDHGNPADAPVTTADDDGWVEA
ncbi:hypothetical protein ACIBK9_12335 [Nonomuraea sp. NPDC050227]